MKVTTPPCPACGKPMRDKPVENALSRYRRYYICAPCGTREAIDGDWWDETNPYAQSAMSMQRAWRDYWEAAQ